MSTVWLYPLLFTIVLLALAWPLGVYMAHVYDGARPWPMRCFAPIENGLYRLMGVTPHAQMAWRQYAFAVLAFNALGVLALYAVLRLQAWLPLNPQGLAGLSPDLAFNTAVRFRHEHQLASLFR